MYDDLTLPSGQISDSETNFLNAYKVTTGCANVQPTDHSLAHMQNAGCDALFGMQSNMALCYPFVDNEPYKIACQHGTALKNKDTECDIATAYVGICMAHGVPIKVPDKCGKYCILHKLVGVTRNRGCVPREKFNSLVKVTKPNHRSERLLL